MKSGKLYFLRRADGLVKIGYSATFKRRLEQLTKSHGPLEIIRIINGDLKREKRLQQAFAKHHEFGEWFRDSDDLRRAIAGLEDGTVATIVKTDAERAWLRGEADIVSEAKGIIARLIRSRRSVLLCNNEEAFKALAKSYGISEWMLKNIHCGRATTVGAYAMKVLTDALPTELLAHRDHLLAMVEAVEAGRSIA